MQLHASCQAISSPLRQEDDIPASKEPKDVSSNGGGKYARRDRHSEFARATLRKDCSLAGNLNMRFRRHGEHVLLILKDRTSKVFGGSEESETALL